ncbi:unnamed protein product [Clonostachys byssicola]|uniref:Integral membrane protein n=1 Tax=Clonostachys byssicola TaxID=160290 RepID=A0A9N9U7H6_9HYPO|nr:unnamed protein product [Clonostachys byssicola]
MANQQPITTIPPFSDTAKLPSCAAACQPLWDANGKCVPPAVSTADASVYMDCFCKDSRVTGFSTATTGVCDNACDANGLGSIVTWFRGTCSAYGGAQTTTTTGGSSGGSSGSKNRGGGGDWISNHWQWVIMIVIVVVAIVGIWVGACIWRRRYIKKKDRQSTIGQKQSGSASHPSWGPGFPEHSTSAPNIAATPPTDDPRAKGVFMPGALASAFGKGGGEAQEGKKKKWTVRERT